MRAISNIFWLSIKEFRSLWRDAILLLLVIYSFGPGMYIESSGGGDRLNKASVTFVDEDRSSLSRAMQTALYPPQYLPPQTATADEIDRMMDWGETTFVVVIPAGFEADVRAGRSPALQINIDATKTQAAAIGTGYLTATFNTEISRFAVGADLVSVSPVNLVVRRSFNPAGTAVYLFAAASIGVLLGIVARTMAQFALLIMLVMMPIMILSGGMSSIESQPIWLQPITWLLPSRHYMDFATAIAYRGADFGIVWPEFLWTFALGAGFLCTSLLLFRRSVAWG